MPLLGPEGREHIRALGRYGTVGIEMGLSVALGFFGGRWLDGVLGTAPWLTWVGFGLGLAAGFRALYRVARAAREELQANDGPRDGERGRNDDDATPGNR